MAQKPEEIEGSRARAADRGQPDGLSFFAKETDPDALYLGDPSAVTEIVREYCMEVYELRSEAGQGKVTGDEALLRLNALAEKYAGIFYGKDKAYRAMPWNSPDGLGEFINGRLGMTEPPEDAAKTLFMNCANQILAAYALYQDDEIGEEDTQFQIEAAIDDASRILLGLPPASEDEE